ncbi:hypothetical protein AKO1_007391 [Acrasis kona]|uniref:Uncharacterized protein n=1 Tax=Acrasis kona TaxID=1008807 RepID=A0AAW2YTB4_9EUKA
MEVGNTEYINNVRNSSVQRTLREYSKAFDSVHKALYSAPHLPMAYYELALLYTDVCQPKNVSRLIAIAKIKCFNHSMYWKNVLLGYESENKLNFEKAKEYYKAAKSCKDTTDCGFVATFNLGCMSVFKADYASAEGYYLEAAEIHQLNTEWSNWNHHLCLCYNNIGMCYSAQFKESSAIRMFTIAIKSGPNLLRSYQERITSYMRYRNHELALEDCHTAFKLTTHKPTLSSLCLCMASSQTKTSDKVNDLLKAIELDPRNDIAYDSLTDLLITFDNTGASHSIINYFIHWCKGDGPCLAVLYSKLHQIEKQTEKKVYYGRMMLAMHNGLMDRIS